MYHNPSHKQAPIPTAAQLQAAAYNHPAIDTLHAPRAEAGPSEISVEMEMLSSQVDSLYEAIGLLETALYPVRAREPEDVRGVPNAPAAPNRTSPIGDALAAQNARIMFCLMSLRQLRNSLTL